MIEVYENKFKECPSVQVGHITIDLVDDTPAQAELFRLVANHPDTAHTDKFRGPVTREIGDAFLLVLKQEVQKYQPKMRHSVKISVDN